MCTRAVQLQVTRQVPTLNHCAAAGQSRWRRRETDPWLLTELVTGRCARTAPDHVRSSFSSLGTVLIRPGQQRPDTSGGLGPARRRLDSVSRHRSDSVTELEASAVAPVAAGAAGVKVQSAVASSRRSSIISRRRNSRSPHCCSIMDSSRTSSRRQQQAAVGIGGRWLYLGSTTLALPT